MQKTINNIREMILSPVAAALIGLLCGAGARYAEFKDAFIEDFTSRLMLWVFACVLVTLLCSTQKQAFVYVSFFAVSMVVANFALWYALAGSHDYAEPSILRLVCWIIFALLSPLFAAGVYMSKTHSLFAILMRPAIIVVPLIVTLIAFRNLRIADFIFTAGLIYLIYIKKLGRTDGS